MFNFDDEDDLPTLLFDDEDFEADKPARPKLDLCPKNLTAPMDTDDFGYRPITQGPHQWESVYRDNRPNSTSDDQHYTIYRCVFCRKYNSRWESKQFNSHQQQ